MTADFAARQSRLERMLARLVTQKACLEYARAELGDRQGVILELGLGKGRTYDHLRKLFPTREIYAFDLQLHAPRDCIPDAGYLKLGEFRESLSEPRLAALNVIMVHADVGSEDRAGDARMVAELAPTIDKVLAPGALVLTDREMQVARWEPLPLPDEVGDWPYFIYRAGA
ncbi:MAG: class I SAM-dependent methyltransferase [Gammaproteobacteria bacterium]|nr:class I SAM-dependent methyltransferase [Gammaproteobacteria bacterium]